MSYILEALKKSQQERRSGQVPDLQTLHAEMVDSAGDAPRWPYWALGLALFALAFLLGWLRPWEANNHASPRVDVPVASASPVVTAPLESAAVPQAMVETAVATTEPVASVIPEAVRPAPVSGPIRPESVPDLGELPDLLRQAIPDMQFAGHVYSANPQQRSVIINNHFMSEGDNLLPDLRLLQITPDSVIFEYQGQRFRMNVLQDWSFR